MKIIFMGTPDFASKIMGDLIDAGHEIILAVTQTDKPKLRSDKLVFSPVKILALEKNIPVFQPKSFKLEENIQVLRNLEPDIIVVAAYGKILPKGVLELGKYGIINVHASLLPLLRGASPIQHAIIEGYDKTGVTIMRIAEKLDAGNIISQAEVEITNVDTSETLFDKLSVVGSKLLIDTLVNIETGNIDEKVQDDDKATFAPLIKKEDGHLDFSKTMAEIDCKVRGMHPWPGTFALLGQDIIKIIGVEKIVDIPEYILDEYHAHSSDYGYIITTKKEAFVVCGNGIIKINMIQMPGKKKMDIKAFLAGWKLTGIFE